MLNIVKVCYTMRVVVVVFFIVSYMVKASRQGKRSLKTLKGNLRYLLALLFVMTPYC